MKRIISLIAACLFISAAVFAQDEKLAPGIYSIVDDIATHLTYTPGMQSNTGFNVIGVEIGNSKSSYKGETAGVQVTDKIVMVIDPGKKAIIKTPKKYDPFIKSMTPDLIMIVPLEVNKNKRVYNAGTSVQGFNTKKHTRVEFEWQLIDENTFEITGNFEPGEYGIYFKPAKLGDYDWSSIYGFCVAEKAVEETPAEAEAPAAVETPAE